MKKYIAGMMLVAMAIALAPVFVQAQTPVTDSKVNTTELLELLQTLMKQVENLQKQLAQVQEQIKDNLKEGVADEDVKKIQEMLATDPALYPRGIVSGYFGPLTKDAIERFQKRHELAVTGEIDADTKKLMLEYFKERKNGKFPPGLLLAPGIDKKMRDRLIEKDNKYYLNCDDKKASGPLCKDLKNKDKYNEDEVNNENDIEVVSTTIMDKADVAIDEAKVSIGNLEDLITTAVASTTNLKSIKKAESEFEDAENYLVKAESYFKKKDYKKAYYYAVKAERDANKGIEKLES